MHYNFNHKEVISNHLYKKVNGIIPLTEQGPAQNDHCILRMVIAKQQWQSAQNLSSLYLKPNATKHGSTQEWSLYAKTEVKYTCINIQVAIAKNLFRQN
jgi:hypothetical protein